MASSYWSADFLHAEVRARLLERLELVKLAPVTVLDLGAGPPEATAELAPRFPAAQMLAMDLVPAMLGTTPRGWTRIAGDATRLPLADGSVDVVIASMLLHWCGDPAAALAEARRVLRYPGLFTFATLGPDTLRELRSAWGGQGDDSGDRHGHTLAFADMHNIGDALVKSGFAEPVVDAETLTVTYPDISRLVGDLRGVGAANLGPKRRLTLTGRGRWRQMTERYDRQRNAAGLLPATFEIVYGHAWSTDPARRRQIENGEIVVPLERLLRKPLNPGP